MDGVSRAVAVIAALASMLAFGASTAQGACKQWSSRTLLSGQGWLENLAFDPHRGLFVSAIDQRKVLRVSPSGDVRTLIQGVNFPGGLAVRGGSLFFDTGDGPPNSGPIPGTIGRYRFKSGKRTT